MCCHPALTPASSVALALRAVGGLTTGEIARAFLVPEATMAQRISRAKQLIKASGVPFERPGESERAARLAAVLHVLYLMFNEGYASSAGPSLSRPDLSGEAIRLVRMVHALVPDEPEVTGLLALLLLTDARRTARTGAERGAHPARRAGPHAVGLGADRRRGRAGVLGAAAGARGTVPAASGDRRGARRGAERRGDRLGTDLALYSVLARLADNPMVELNRAIAAAMVQGPAVGLEMIDALERDGRSPGTTGSTRCAVTSTSASATICAPCSTTRPQRTAPRRSPNATTCSRARRACASCRKSPPLSAPE